MPTHIEYAARAAIVYNDQRIRGQVLPLATRLPSSLHPIGLRQCSPEPCVVLKAALGSRDQPADTRYRQAQFSRHLGKT